MRAAALIDTHCHLVLLQERGLLTQAFESCTHEGVEQLITVGLNVEDSDSNRIIAEEREGIFFSVGWHPHEPLPPDGAQLRALDDLLHHPRAVAVGEIGLDLYFRSGYHETSLVYQLEGIHAMFELAEAHRKPVILHDREAHEEILGVMRQHPGVRGVMHCFSGDAAFAQSCVDLGYLVSFSGIVTFPKAEGIVDAARRVPENAFMVETDSPFLAPVPYRGRANLPGYVAATADAVAQIRQQPPAEVRSLTTQNARDLFGLATEQILL